MKSLFFPSHADIRLGPVVLVVGAISQVLLQTSGSFPAVAATVSSPTTLVPPAAAVPRVVVAAIELNAVNMYHEWFHLGGALYPEQAPNAVTESVLREFGIDSEHIIRLTRTGDIAADILADEEQFDAVDEGEPYWYEGTNVIGVSFAPKGKRLRSDLNAFKAGVPGHATAVVAAALKANSQAIVVAIQADNAKIPTSTGEEIGAAGFGPPAEISKPSGEKFAFQHPAIDIVSTSYGNRYNAPYGSHLLEGYNGVVERGKMHFGAPHNSATPITGSNSSGPWWTVAVGGYYEAGGFSLSPEGNEYRETGSGQLTDVIADQADLLPLCVSCQQGVAYSWGTSFATPRAAGTVSSVLLEARQNAKHKGGIRFHAGAPVMVKDKSRSITVWELRRAMEEAAHLPSEKTSDPLSWNSVPGAPWITHAWGAISPNPDLKFIDKALAYLGVAGIPDPPKPAEACAFQTAGIQLRKEYWNRVAPFSGSAGQGADPFVPCLDQPKV